MFSVLNIRLYTKMHVRQCKLLTVTAHTELTTEKAIKRVNGSMYKKIRMRESGMKIKFI